MSGLVTTMQWFGKQRWAKDWSDERRAPYHVQDVQYQRACVYHEPIIRVLGFVKTDAPTGLRKFRRSELNTFSGSGVLPRNFKT